MVTKSGRLLSVLGPLFIFGLLTITGFWIEKKHVNTTTISGAHPGYFQQWFEEKKSPDGTIPAWLHAQWASWDKSQFNRRSGENIIDTLYELGPSYIGGRTRSLWIDPRNDNVILAAAISGGMWRSENGGKNWKALDDQATSLMASCITSNPFNPDIVYYGTGESRANSADVDGNGVYKSTDGGKTFSVLSSTVGLNGFEAIWDIEHSQVDSNTLFVGTNSRGLWRSTDAGQTWAQVLSSGNQQVTDVHTLPNGKVFASMHTNRIYVSDSNGKAGTFSLVSMPSMPGSGSYRRMQLASCRNFPNVMYCLFEGYGFSDPPSAFYKSSDGGRTWVKKVAPTAIGAGYQAYCVMLGVHPTDTNYVVAGGVNIAQTSNGGSSWSAKTTGHSDHHAFAAFHTNTNYFLVGTDGGVYKYRYNSSSIQENLNFGYKVTQFYAGAFGPTGYASIAGAQDNGTQVATAELTSKQFYGADGAYCHIGLQDGTVAYLSTQNQGIRRIDNFNPAIIPSFTTNISDARFATDGVNFINSYAMNPADQMQLYYRTNRYIYRTADGGDYWEQMSTQRTGMKAIGVSNHTNPTVYYGGSAAQLYKMDSALTSPSSKEVSYNTAFPAAVTNDFINCIAVHPKDRYTIYISFSNINNQPRIWRISSLQGSSPVFKNVSGNLPPSLPVNFVAADPQFPDKNLFAGTDFGLYYTTDSGKTWTKELRIPNVAVHEVKMREDRKLFVYTHGRGMWVLLLKGTSSVKNTAKAEVKLYPNPAKEKVNIQVVGSGRFTYNIYNLQGKKIAEGSWVGDKTEIKTTNFAAGQYFITVEGENMRFTDKLILQY